MNSKLLLIFYLFTGIQIDISAQNPDFPQNAVAGKCYKKCLHTPQYETIAQEVLVKDAYKKISIEPAQYDTVYKEILEEEGYVVFEVVQAEFTTAEVEVIIEPAYTEYSYIPPVFETQEEYVVLEPARYEWKRQIDDINCFDQKDVEDCVVWCWTVVPPRLDTLYEEVVKTHAKPLEKQFPAVTQNITKTMVLTPASLKRTIVPPKYRTVSVIQLVKPAQTVEVEIPAEYQTIAVRKRVESPPMEDWMEVTCPKGSYGLN